MNKQQQSTALVKLLQIFAFSFGLWLILGANVPSVQAYHFPWDQGHDTTDWKDPSEPGVCEGGMCQCDPTGCRSKKSPVYMATGYFVWTDTDIMLKGRPELKISRTYNSNDPRDGLFGNGWSFTHDRALFKVSKADGQGITRTAYIMRLANGRRYQFDVASDGTITPPPGIFQRIEPQQDGTTHLINLDGSYEVYAMDSLQQVVDRNGNVLNFQYDDDRVLSGISDTNGRSFAFARNSAGRIISITDHAGRSWEYDYDINGNLTSVRDPLGGERRYQYQEYTPVGDNHTYHQLTQITDPTDVIITKVTYNNERVRTYTEGENTFTLAYDTTNRVVTKTDSVGSAWRSKYNQDGLYIERTDPLGNTVFYEHDSNGLITKITDKLGNSFSSTFDALGRLTSKTDIRGSVILEYQGDSPWATKVVSRTGRINQVTYDSNGNLITVVDPANAVTHFDWNSSGDLTKIINALSQEITTATNTIGLSTKITDTLDRSIILTYDNRGNIITVTNAAGETVHYEYDDLDRVTREINALGHIIEYSYDSASRLINLTISSSKSISYNYDSYGRLSQRTNYDGSQHVYSFRADNLINQITQPSGEATSYTYDKAKQIIQINAGSEVTSFQYSARGELLKAINPIGTVVMNYDDTGRLLSETVNGQVIQYSYNNDDELVQLVGLGKVQAYEYDNRGLLTQISGATGQYGFNYDALGRRTQLVRPNASKTSYQYDSSGQQTQIQHSGIFNITYDYQFDNAGRIIGTSDGITKSYQYDDISRLIQSIDNFGIQDYQYDTLGNILGNGRIYDSANRLLEDNNSIYNYDANGNLTQKLNKTTGERRVYTWNARNQLNQIDTYPDNLSTVPTSTTIYAYGPLNRRWSKTIDGFTYRYVYAGDKRIGTLDTSGNIIEYVTFSGLTDEPLGMEKNGDNYFFHSNHQKSVLALSNFSEVVATYQYDDYGKVTVSGNDNLTDILYTGREYDDNGLYYYRHRYYDSSMVRFINEDSIGLSGGVNTYAYVHNNPINLIDPSGNTALTLGGSLMITPIPGARILGGAILIGSALYIGWQGYIHYSKPPSDAHDSEGAKAPGKPGKEEGFEDPKGGEQWVPNPNPGKGGSSHGWKDSKGRVWCPTGQGGRAHAGPHWDVQDPKTRGNTNVPPGTNINDL